MIDLAHAVFSFSLSYILNLPIVTAIFGALLSDLDLTFDYIFPLVHRGVLHTPIALVVILALFYLITRKKGSTLALGLGYLTHLFLDSFTPMGIMWFFPYDKYYSLNLVYSSGLIGNVSIIAFSIFMFVLWKYNEVILKWTKS